MMLRPGGSMNETRCIALLTCTLVPEGQTRIAQQFIAGITRMRHLSPGGTAEGILPTRWKHIFSRAYGTDPAIGLFPSNELLG